MCLIVYNTKKKGFCFIYKNYVIPDNFSTFINKSTLLPCHPKNVLFFHPRYCSPVYFLFFYVSVKQRTNLSMLYGTLYRIKVWKRRIGKRSSFFLVFVFFYYYFALKFTFVLFQSAMYNFGSILCVYVCVWYEIYTIYSLQRKQKYPF